jgi:hypothetical protein
MKTFQNTAAQGEISIRRIDALPPGVKQVAPQDGKFIVGHSETGHHHVMTMDRAQVFEAINPPAGMRVLYAILDAPKLLEHLRPHDTHEPIQFQPGVYELSSGREFDPYAELIRSQMD